MSKFLYPQWKETEDTADTQAKELKAEDSFEPKIIRKKDRKPEGGFITINGDIYVFVNVDVEVNSDGKKKAK